MADREEYQSLVDDEDDGDDDVSRHLSPLCDPRHLLHRILVLVFMCFLGFGENRLRFTLSAGVITVTHTHTLSYSCSHRVIFSWQSVFDRGTLFSPCLGEFGLGGVGFHVKVKLFLSVSGSYFCYDNPAALQTQVIQVCEAVVSPCPLRKHT